MVKKYLPLAYILVAVIFIIGVGLVIKKGINPAALSVPYLSHAVC